MAELPYTVIGVISIIGFVIFFFIGYLNSRITRLSEKYDRKYELFEANWRSDITCKAIHEGLNGDIKEIKEAIKEIYSILRNKGK